MVQDHLGIRQNCIIFVGEAGVYQSDALREPLLKKAPSLTCKYLASLEVTDCGKCFSLLRHKIITALKALKQLAPGCTMKDICY
jgi:hypothetical protein